ncbi:MAG: putative D-proline reductase gamma subunit [Actinomycetota bacterium]
MLAHIFEAAGIATVVLSSIRAMAEKTAPPRALHCEFPLGRPLGIPNDAKFQHDVLQSAFALLDEPRGPVLVDYPVVIEAESDSVACALPPRFDPNVLPAVDEARGIRKAYDRAVERIGVSSVGRVISADEVPAALESLQKVVDGAPWTEVLPNLNTTALCHDIRTYYEEAALELVNGPAPGGRALEDWFFEKTEAGKVVLAARAAIRDSGAKFPIWFYMTPGHR